MYGCINNRTYYITAVRVAAGSVDVGSGLAAGRDGRAAAPPAVESGNESSGRSSWTTSGVMSPAVRRRRPPVEKCVLAGWRLPKVVFRSERLSADRASLGGQYVRGNRTGFGGPSAFARVRFRLLRDLRDFSYDVTIL